MFFVGFCRQGVEGVAGFEASFVDDLAHLAAPLAGELRGLALANGRRGGGAEAVREASDTSRRPQ